MTVLGATGSVGSSTLDLLAADGGARFRVVALTAQRNVDKLARAAIAHRAEFAAIADEGLHGELKRALAGSGVEGGAGPQAVVEAAMRHADLCVSAIVGVAGLPATLAAVRAGADVALANKESLVCAGQLLTDAAARAGVRLIPVDSEHSAIFQVLQLPERVEKLTLTASGGPFRLTPATELAAMTPEQACAHPNWSMGAKISVDSATMMNKGLELIEAVHLFAMPQSRIDIVVHPQQIIHSLVAYVDGSVLAQLGAPDMRTPIAYALAWPDRMAAPQIQRLDLAQIGRLDFEPPDMVKFPAIALARAAAEAGGGAAVTLNAANEVAVDAFLRRRIGFLDIASVVRDVMALDADRGAPESFEAVFELDRRARAQAQERLRLAA